MKLAVLIFVNNFLTFLIKNVSSLTSNPTFLLFWSFALRLTRANPIIASEVTNHCIILQRLILCLLECYFFKAHYFSQSLITYISIVNCKLFSSSLISRCSAWGTYIFIRTYKMSALFSVRARPLIII